MVDFFLVLLAVCIVLFIVISIVAPLLQKKHPIINHEESKQELNKKLEVQAFEQPVISPTINNQRVVESHPLKCDLCEGKDLRIHQLEIALKQKQAKMDILEQHEAWRKYDEEKHQEDFVERARKLKGSDERSK